MYVLVLGLDVLGNPFGLLRGLTEGVGDLFYEPYQVSPHPRPAGLTHPRDFLLNRFCCLVLEFTSWSEVVVLT